MLGLDGGKQIENQSTTFELAMKIGSKPVFEQDSQSRPAGDQQHLLARLMNDRKIGIERWPRSDDEDRLRLFAGRPGFEQVEWPAL